MVADSRTAQSGPGPGLAAGKLRPLNQPRKAVVDADEAGAPVAVAGCAVESISEAWRIEDEWWRPRPISRTYWRLLLADGRTVDVYYDAVRRRWYRQAYTG